MTTRRKLNYFARPPMPLAVTIGAAIFAGICLTLVAAALLHARRPPVVASPVDTLNKYFRESEGILSDAGSTDAQRASRLIFLISSARRDGALPLRTGWPSDAEKELAKLLSAPENRSSVGEAAAAQFRQYLRTCYPSFQPDTERPRRGPA
jgi:hypothetical protein